MAKFKPYKILSTELDNLPIREGQFIVTTDTHEIYIDTEDDYERQKYVNENIYKYNFFDYGPVPREILDIESSTVKTNTGPNPTVIKMNKQVLIMTKNLTKANKITITVPPEQNQSMYMPMLIVYVQYSINKEHYSYNITINDKKQEIHDGMMLQYLIYPEYKEEDRTEDKVINISIDPYTTGDLSFSVQRIDYNSINDAQYLSVANQYPYTPFDDYHPATKKYVDDKILIQDMDFTTDSNGQFLTDIDSTQYTILGIIHKNGTISGLSGNAGIVYTPYLQYNKNLYAVKVTKSSDNSTCGSLTGTCTLIYLKNN